MRSHSDNFITRFLEGYWINDKYYPPPCDVVSLFTDQVHANDISRRLAAAYGFKIYPTIADALTLGTGKLAVDGVLLIGEHGNYPNNEKGQKLYPRYEFMKQVVDVYDKSGRAVPVFNDKHLSYDWDKAKWMYDQSRAAEVPDGGGFVVLGNLPPAGTGLPARRAVRGRAVGGGRLGRGRRDLPQPRSAAMFHRAP